jgi:DNA polymerase III sliding clamp (beta) subunit (PCNA family)
MKLTIETDQLKKALARMTVVPGLLNTDLRTLAVVIEADDFSAKLRRTTTSANLNLDIEAGVEEPGMCGVNYDLLINSINAMPGAETTLESDGKILRVTSGKTKAELHVYPDHDLLPERALDDPDLTLDFASGDFIRAVNQVFPAAAKESREIKFAGVCLRVQQDRLTAFSVDRKRVHIATLGPKRAPLNPNGSSDLGIMIVSDSIAAILRLLGDTDWAMTLTFGEGAVRVKTGEIDAVLPLAEDQPPNMSSVLPGRGDSDHQFSCSRKDFLRAVRTAAPLGFQDQRVLSLKIDPLGVEIIADTQHGAKLGHYLGATVKGGGGQHLRCNAHYLTDFINAIEGENIVANYAKDGSMLWASNDQCMAVIMLIRDAANATA